MGEDKALALKAVKNLFIFQGACVFKSGLVHCDPHSGNILVNINGHTYALDWGCRAELSVEFQKHLKVIFANLPHIKASTKDGPQSIILLLLLHMSTSRVVVQDESSCMFQMSSAHTLGSLPYVHFFIHVV